MERFQRNLGLPRPTDPLSLVFPDDWAIGRYNLRSGLGPGAMPFLERLVPRVQLPDGEGGWVDPTEDSDVSVPHLSLSFPSGVECVRLILSARVEKEVEQDDVLSLAARSPQAFEALKGAVKQYRSHAQRMGDAVALRRSPDFNRAAARWKAQIRSLAQRQHDAVLAVRSATRELNAALASRDAELASLDPGYVRKKVTAAEALAAYGFQLDPEDVREAEEAVRREREDVLAALEADF